MKFFIYLILSFGIISNVQSIEPNINPGDPINAQTINDINKPDFDSGWVPAHALSNNIIEFTHNFGSIPSRVSIMTAVSIPEGINGQRDMIRVVPPDSMGITFRSPEATNLTNNKVFLVFYGSDHFFYCDTNAQCHRQDGVVYGTGTFQSGEIRIKLWK